MARPFNFFQTAESGRISAYSGYFTGFYTPSGMFPSPDSLLYFLDHESYETISTYTVNFRSDIYPSKLDEPSLGVIFSGNCYPVESGVALLYINVTGNQAKHNIDTHDLLAEFTGNFQSGLLDNPTYTIRVTGKFQRILQDTPTLQTSFTGDFLSHNIDTPTFDTRFSGNFVNYEKNNVLLSNEISGIFWSRGHVKQTTTLEPDSYLVDVTLARIYWSRAGG